MNKKDLKIEFYRGQGPGGQHRNKTENACRVTHIPTGVVAHADCRKRNQSKKEALFSLRQKLVERTNKERAVEKKSRRDKAIVPKLHIRTYNYPRDEVIDHRSGKRANIKQVLKKGEIWRMRDET